MATADWDSGTLCDSFPWVPAELISDCTLALYVRPAVPLYKVPTQGIQILALVQSN